MTRGRPPLAATRADPFGLTPREREVAELLASGLRTRTIVGRLWISADAVHKHTMNAYRKVGVHSRAELALRLLGADEKRPEAVPVPELANHQDEAVPDYEVPLDAVLAIEMRHGLTVTWTRTGGPAGERGEGFWVAWRRDRFLADGETPKALLRALVAKGWTLGAPAALGGAMRL